MYHFSVKTFSRSNKQSATAAIAYRAGCVIECARYQVKHDYSKRKDVLYRKIFVPEAVNSFVWDRSTLWNAVEAAESRKNSTVAREFEIALPYELSPLQQQAMLIEVCNAIVGRHGCAVDASIHAPHKTAHTERKQSKEQAGIEGDNRGSSQETENIAR